MNGSNAPVITNALVAWPPPPSRFGGRAGGGPPSSRLSYAQPTNRGSQPGSPFTSPFGSPPLGASQQLSPATGVFSPLGGYGVPRSYTDDHGSGSASASGSGSSTPARTLSLSLKGKERQGDYPPPKAPLSPSQLARIASSFGIHVPGGPPSAPSPSRGDGTSTSRASSRSASPAHALGAQPPPPMVAVVPPVSLLAPVPGADAEAERDRARRWRRGRLVPLQPTLGAMLVAIAREFGLPSTQGVSVYLGQDSSRASVSSASDEPGPLITQATWTALFAHAARGGGVSGVGVGSLVGASLHNPDASISPISTPGSTPRKQPRTTFGFGAMMSQSQSVAARHMAAETPDDPDKSLPTDDAGPSRSSSLQSSSASSFSPRTPASLGPLSTTIPVFGTVEFDVEPSQARWLADWIRTGGAARRGLGDIGGGGVEVLAVRDLQLVERLNDPRPKFMRQMEEEKERAERKAAERHAAAEREAMRLAAEREEAAREAERIAMEEEEEGERQREEAARLAAQREEEAREAQLVAQRLAAEQAAAEEERRQQAQRDAELETEREAERQLAESAQVAQFGLDNDMIRNTMHGGSPVKTPTLSLASPVSLSSQSTGGLLSPTSPLSSSGHDPRASGIVMADQLNTLERMMRDLSPREIRTSGRHSGSASNSSHSNGSRPPARLNLNDLPERGSSRLPYLQPDGLSRSTTHSTARTELSTTPKSPRDPTSPDRAAWPAVPFKSIESPQSPGLQEYFNKGGVPLTSPPLTTAGSDGKRGLENGVFARAQESESRHRTVDADREREMREARRERAERDKAMREGRASSMANGTTAAAAAARPMSIAPMRPARPPTPDLDTPEISSHVLPPQMVDVIKNSPSPQMPGTAILPSMPGMPTRSPSSKIKRRLSTKILRPKDRAHAYAVANSRGSTGGPNSGEQPPVPNSRESSAMFTDEPLPVSVGALHRSPPTRISEFGNVEEIRHAPPPVPAIPVPTGNAPYPFGHGRGVSVHSQNSDKDKGFTSRFFSFGNKKRSDGAPMGAEDKRLPNTIQHISSPLPGVKHVQVSPAELAATSGATDISTPLGSNTSTPTTTLNTAGQLTPNGSSHSGAGGGAGDRSSLPNSPTSPRNVRRKPVPGTEGARDSVDSGAGTLR